jgi:hypothetical protein
VNTDVPVVGSGSCVSVKPSVAVDIAALAHRPAYPILLSATSAPATSQVASCFACRNAKQEALPCDMTTVLLPERLPAGGLRMEHGVRMLAEIPRCMPCHQRGSDGPEYCATERNEGCLVHKVILKENLAKRCPDGPDKPAQIIVLAHGFLEERDIALPISWAKWQRYYLNPVPQGQAFGNLLGKIYDFDIDGRY